MLIGIIAAALVVALIGVGAGLWWRFRFRTQPQPPRPTDSSTPMTPLGDVKCATPGCARTTWNNKPDGSTCCRSCLHSNGATHGPLCEQKHAVPVAPTPPPPPPGAQQHLPERYVAATNQIRLGQPADAAHGLPRLLGVSDAQVGHYLQDPEEAIKREVRINGDARDQDNLARILAGTYLDSNGETKTLDELLQHPYAQMAKLGRHHILALRLYTTESYPKINNPLRQVPPQRPHPFAATTYFISEGIKLLRAVAANMSDPNSEQVYWRGMKDLGITNEFRAKGGTDFACVSTTSDEGVAVHQFAASALPLVFRVVTKNFITRGADIAFLSVMPHEKEFMYPPLTYLQCTAMKMEKLCGVDLLVATVEPHMA